MQASSIPAFFVAFAVTPFAISAGEVVSSFQFAKRKRSKNLSLTLSQVSLPNPGLDCMARHCFACPTKSQRLYCAKFAMNLAPVQTGACAASATASCELRMSISIAF